MAWTPELKELEKRKALTAKMGGPERVKRQHDGGRLTIRERIDRISDARTFHEVGAIAGVGEYDEKGDLKGGAISLYQAKGGKWEYRETVGGGAPAAPVAAEAPKADGEKKS